MKPKIGDTVQFKKSGITGTVEKILRGVYVVKTHESRLPAWPEELIVVGLSEVSLDKEMEEHQKLSDEIMAIQGIEPIEAEDEDGNVINATKIVLEKRKKEYPKSYVECCDTLYINSRHDECYEACLQGHPMQTFARLLICRDAYWKLYGEEIGLDKPWEPDWKKHQGKWVITLDLGYIVTGCVFSKNHILAFPTEEMRDAFKENFDPDIEKCKLLL